LYKKEKPVPKINQLGNIINQAQTGINAVQSIDRALGGTSIGGALGQAQGALNTASQVLGGGAAALNSLKSGNLSGLVSAVGGIASALRSVGIPEGAEASAALSAAASSIWKDTKDWRVSLSIPKSHGFQNSPLLEPINKLGAMVFPYTPAIQMRYAGNYTSMTPIHNNYPIFAYQNSSVDAMTIAAEFYNETAVDGRYWVAAVHYFRSITKMAFGQSSDRGQPPPVVRLNGYGDFVFNDVPVVVTSVDIELPQDPDYIEVPLAGGAEGLNIAGIPVNMPTKSGVAYVPTFCTISVSVQPLFSRSSQRAFSLNDFVNGKYVGKGIGYL
jgi:hypothetical protein